MVYFWMAKGRTNESNGFALKLRVTRRERTLLRNAQPRASNYLISSTERLRGGGGGGSRASSAGELLA
jgi:hypothetical protein